MQDYNKFEIPASAQIKWPKKIWVYKRVARSVKEHNPNYDEHKILRLIDSRERWSYMHRKWKIYPEQVSIKMERDDREARRDMNIMLRKKKPGRPRLKEKCTVKAPRLEHNLQHADITVKQKPKAHDVS
tara:strand:+ start:2081 stop:2467 length:387 start_codon:yes stop_codon:yes gene_type:complete